MQLTHSRAVGVMVLVTLLWSTAGVVTRHLESARSFEVTFWRSLFTALTLIVLVPLLRGRGVWANMRNAGAAFWASGLCWSVMFTAFMVALTLTSVANVLVTMATGPLLTALIARVFIGHRIPTRTWAAIGVAGCGVAIMYGTQVSLVNMLGTVVALCVPIAGATNWTLTQHSHAKGHDVDMVPAVMVGAVLSCLYTLPLALPFQANTHDLALLAFLGVTQLAIPCVLCVLCARVLMAPEMSLLALLEVLFGIALAWIGAGEVPRTAVFVGGTLVMGALVVNELLAVQKRKMK
jgi:drug/metabolite transporter (DMT)-like permease